ncbi:Mu transposase C-terminal domain-containing protein [[Clostridium] colinum]|uniref:Mu transposase C-terminal domain-containing protein n=1 Tax=[Clostridium] colinum TaxID=36835 RepID=UPI002024BE11|nr:Mu transposase C-terminal domain-containing protein [[Clostridium] colinum]
MACKYDKIYISLEEASELEGMSYHSILMRMQRNPQAYNIKKEQAIQGGKDRTFISVSSLSSKAQALYKKKMQADVPKEEIKDWYIDIDINWYKANYQKNFNEALERFNIVERLFNEDRLKSKILAEELNVTERNARRVIDKYLNALQIIEQKRQNSDIDFSYLKVLALAKKVKIQENFYILNEEMKAFLENSYYDKDFLLNNNPITNLYDDFVKWCEFKEIEQIPHYNTIRRYILHIREIDGEGATVLASKGTRAWKNSHMMKRFRDTKALKVLEIVQGDVHTFDCWVSVKRANGSIEAIRPCLVAWIDMRSRALVGWVITECPDAQIMKQSLIHTIYPKANKELPYGVPKYLLIDNGKEYTAKTLTGRERTERVCFDEDAKGFYRSIGIKDDIRSLPYQPWSKAQVERYFSTVEMKFGKRIKSYTGTLTGRKTSGKVQKDIKKMLEKGQLLTIEDFAEKFEQWVVTEFHNKKHRGLIRQGEQTSEPISVFNNADKYVQAPPPLQYAISLLMKGETRVVTNTGIRRTIKGKEVWYTNPELTKYQGRRVEFKYHTEDITKVFVYDENGKFICEAISYELLHIAPKLSEDSLIEHIKDQKRQQQQTNETIKNRRKTYEERQLDYEEAGKKLVAPTLSNEELKTVAFVNDNRFKEDTKVKQKELKTTHNDIKESSKEIAEDYLQRLGDEVFDRIC